MKTKILFFALLSFFLLTCNRSNTKDCCTSGKINAVDSSFIALPDIFTPNADGINDILYVRTKNIASIHFTVSHNRRLVFESWDLSIGWDGSYKGKLSKERSYSFGIDATTVNGKTISLTGTVCVIRDNCVKSSIAGCAFDSQWNGFMFDMNLPSYENIQACH